MKRPDRVVLQGRHVKIVPLHAATHAAALYADSKDAGLWRYLFNGPYTDEAEFRAWLEGRETFSDDGKGRAGVTEKFRNIFARPVRAMSRDIVSQMQRGVLLVGAATAIAAPERVRIQCHWHNPKGDGVSPLTFPAFWE